MNENIEYSNYVECPCGNCEEIPADQKRTNLNGAFTLIDYPDDRGLEDDGTAFYKCIKCEIETQSQIIPTHENEDEIEDYLKSKNED